jgi:hypothetical protein
LGGEWALAAALASAAVPAFAWAGESVAEAEVAAVVVVFLVVHTLVRLPISSSSPSTRIDLPSLLLPHESQPCPLLYSPHAHRE